MDEVKIAAMRKGGRILGNLLRDLKAYVQPGLSEREIDAWVRAQIVARGAEVAYDHLEEEFPGAICISVNEELVHGIPTDYILEAGDKVSFDLDILVDGYYVDSAFTMIVGGNKAGSPAVRNLIKVNEEAMWAGIHQVRAGARIGDVGHAVEKVLRAHKLGVIENYIGHGIGKTMHEDPEVPNYGRPGHGLRLRANMTIAIEPMVNAGGYDVVMLDDGWTVVTADGKPSAHYENTVAITEDGVEILSL